jgi:post-segregation antitoxin (ccd killing protein)
MLNISVSSRSLAAARSVDPNVSPAAVRAAVEVALAEMMRQLGRKAGGATRSTAERSPED